MLDVANKPIMLSAIMLDVANKPIMLSAIMLNVVMLSVVASLKYFIKNSYRIYPSQWRLDNEDQIVWPAPSWGLRYKTVLQP